LELDPYRNAITLGVVDEAARSHVIALYNAAGFPCNLIRTVIETPSIDRSVH